MSNLSLNLVEGDGCGHLVFDMHVAVVVVGSRKVDLIFCPFCRSMARMADRVGLVSIIVAEDGSAFFN